jgi:hypothetical protein
MPPIRPLMMLAVLCLVTAGAHAIPEPPIDLGTVYLTWQQDPTTTMTVHWHTVGEAGASVAQVRPAGSTEWTERRSTTRPMPGIDGRTVHTAEFTGLEPDTLYDLWIVGHKEMFRFRTMPATNDREIRFIVCGDMYKKRPLLDQMFTRVSEREIDFAVFAGDLAYASGALPNAKRWVSFFDSIQKNMTGQGNRLIPIIPLLGNHEVSGGGFNMPIENAPFFFALFAFPGEPGYGVLDFGKYLSLVCLDTQHVNDVDGEQLTWLTDTLKARQDIQHLAAVYHVPAWPSARSTWQVQNRRVRKAWVPVFEEHGVDFAFEHHEHAFKRTHPIKNGKVDPTGIVYFGDGGFATGENRVPKSPGNWLSGGRWYLAKSGSENHFFLVTMNGPTLTFDAINPSGRSFDSYTMIDGVPKPVRNNAAQLSNMNFLWTGLGVVVVLLMLIHSRIEHVRRKLQRQSAT